MLSCIVSSLSPDGVSRGCDEEQYGRRAGNSTVIPNWDYLNTRRTGVGDHRQHC